VPYGPRSLFSLSRHNLEKRLIGIDGKYNMPFSSSFRGLLLIPLTSILTIPLPSGIAGLLAVNTVYSDPLFGEYDLKFAYIYIIYNAALLSKH
jgi:hypothetical protein